MPNPRRKPPVLSRLWLGFVLPPGEREPYLGDLEEGFHAIADAEGLTAARRWYRRQARQAPWRLVSRPPRPPGSVAREALSPFARTFRFMEGASMLDDLRFAWRRLRHAPSFTAIAVLTLAVAVGANTAILSIADGVLFRPLPYDQPDRLFLIQQANRSTGARSTMVAASDIERLAAHRGLGKVGLYSPGPRLMEETPDGLSPVATISVTPSYFQVLGVTPAAGRLLADSDIDAGGHVVMLSYEAWQRRFNVDPAVVGRTLQFHQASLLVVGVLPPSFYFPTYASRVRAPDFVMVAPPPETGARRGFIHPVVRLAPGVTREQAQSEMDGLFPPDQDALDRGGGSRPYLDEIRTNITLTGRPILWFLVVAAGLVLLLACGNLANLCLAHSETRRSEFGVRLALGARRLRIARSVLFEMLLVGAASTVVAIVLTRLTFDLLLDQVPGVAYGNMPVGVDGRLMAISLAIGLAAGLVAAIRPAWRSCRLDPIVLIRRGSRVVGPSRLWRGAPMIAVQVAGAVVLVFAAVVAAKAFVSVLSAPLGFNPTRLAVLAGVVPPEATDPAAFVRSMIATLEAQPGVRAAAATYEAPLDGSLPWTSEIRTAGAAVGLYPAWPGYHETLENTLVRGRLLTWEDAGAGDVAVVSTSAAEALFGAQEPINQIIQTNDGTLTWRVVGVVADLATQVDGRKPPAVYVLPPVRMSIQLVVRTDAADPAVMADLRRQVATFSNAILPRAEWMQDRFDQLTAVRNPRFQTLVLSAFASIALFLTALGTFGVVSFAVAMRTKEMGIRLAIGAAPGELVRLVVRQAFLPVAAGLVVGLLATRLLAGLVEAQLYDVSTSDPLTLAGAAVTVVLAALAAAYIPARRASHVDPLVVLRTD